MEGIKREYTSDERSPIIDPELRDLLPPITDEEREALTADILKNGCYSPMICMEDMMLVVEKVPPFNSEKVVSGFTL